jgi:cytochrome c
LSLLLCGAGHAAAQDNARGRALFENCLSCHSLDPAKTDLPGPNLSGLIGRRLGGDPRYDYSPVLRAANARGQAWDEALLDRFLADPEEMFPGMWMTGRPMPDAEERRDLLRYIIGPNGQ